MANSGLFGEKDNIGEQQAGLGLDDGGGLRVVNAKFVNEQKLNKMPEKDGIDSTKRVRTVSHFNVDDDKAEINKHKKILFFLDN
jgi:hypothetical protein